MTDGIRINVSNLSEDSKEFIQKLQNTSQSKYDELAKKIEDNKRPLTVDQARFILT